MKSLLTGRSLILSDRRNFCFDLRTLDVCLPVSLGRYYLSRMRALPPVAIFLERAIKSVEHSRYNLTATRQVEGC